MKKLKYLFLIPVLSMGISNVASGSAAASAVVAESGHQFFSNHPVAFTIHNEGFQGEGYIEVDFRGTQDDSNKVFFTHTFPLAQGTTEKTIKVDLPTEYISASNIWVKRLNEQRQPVEVAVLDSMIDDVNLLNKFNIAVTPQGYLEFKAQSERNEEVGISDRGNNGRGASFDTRTSEWHNF